MTMGASICQGEIAPVYALCPDSGKKPSFSPEILYNANRNKQAVLQKSALSLSVYSTARKPFVFLAVEHIPCYIATITLTNKFSNAVYLFH
jgi:hypothetical protein